MVFRAGTWTKVGNFESDSIGLEILRPALWAQVNHSVLSELGVYLFQCEEEGADDFKSLIWFKYSEVPTVD